MQLCRFMPIWTLLFSYKAVYFLQNFQFLQVNYFILFESRRFFVMFYFMCDTNKRGALKHYYTLRRLRNG